MPNKKAKGKRAKTRHKLKRKGSKITVNKYMQEIPDGAKVDVHVEGSIHAGLPDKRFKGETGTVLGKQGSAFVVGLSKGKKLIVGPAHLRISKGTAKKSEVKKEKLEEVKVKA